MWTVLIEAWATCIVCRAVKPHFRFASCCKRTGRKRRIWLGGVRLVFDRSTREHSASQSEAARPAVRRPAPRRAQQAAVLELLPVLPDRNRGSTGSCVRRPKPLVSVASNALAAGLGESPQQVPVTWPTRRPSAAVPARRSAAPPRSARGPPKACGRILRHKQRRDVVAVEPVDDAADLLGADQVCRRSRRGLSAPSRIASLVISWNTSRRDRHLGLEHLAEMPTDGLALAIFVRRQVELLGPLQQAPSACGPADDFSLGTM